MAQQSSFYNADGTTRTYPSSKHIASKQHVAVYFQSVTTSTWSVVESSQYEVVNNSVVFYTAPVETVYSQIEIRVADTTAELEDSPSDIAIVAGAITDVINVSNNISVIDNVNDNMGAITTVSANTTNLNSIVDDVIPNLAEILLADDNALIAINKASEASASATLAEGYAESIMPSSLVKNVDAIADLATIDPTIVDTDNVFVKDLDRGGLFVWSSTGTANGGTVFAGLTGYWARQYSGAVNVKWFGAKGDGATDDTLAIQAMINSFVDMEFEHTGTYKISTLSFSNKTNVNIRTNGAVFYVDDSLSNNTIGVSFSNCSNILFDQLNIKSAGGYETGRSRLLQFADSSYVTVGYLSVAYDAQHLPPSSTASALWTLESGDYSVRFVRVNGFDIGHINISKADVPVSVVDCYNGFFRRISINSYMKGFCIYGGEKITASNVVIYGQSPTYESYFRTQYNDWRKDRPGNNGILIGDDNAVSYPICKDITLENVFISDSGEHGIRLSGANGDRQRFKLSNITIHNSGASGIKCLGSDTTYLYNSVFDNITMTDINVENTVTMSATDGMTSLVFSSTGNTITVSGIEYPENFGTDLTSITISGTVSNNGTFIILSRDSDTQITVSSALVNETANSATVTWTENFKVSHGIQAYNVRDMVISGFNISKVNNTYSCQQGIQIHDAIALVIDGYKIANAKDAGIGIRPNNGGTSNDCRRVNIGRGHIVLTTTGIDLDTEAINLRNFYINGADIQNCINGVRIYNSGTIAGGIIGSFFIRAHFEACTTEFSTTISGAMVALEGDGAIANNALIRDGSTYTDYTAGQFKVLKAGVWTAM